MVMVLTVIVATVVTLAAATQPKVPRTVDVTAFTTPYRQLEVATETGGVLAKVLVDEGDRVKKGQVLVELKNDILRAQLEVSRAQIDSAKLQTEAQQTTLKTAKIAFDRQEKLFKQGVSTSEEFDKAKLEFDLAKLRVEIASSEVRVTELASERDKERLEQTYIRAPRDGEVFRILKHPGEAVEPHRPVLNMVSIDPLFVVAFAPIGTAGAIKVGMKSTLVLENLPGQSLACAVAVVDKVADAASGTYRVKLTLPNPDRALTAGSKGVVTFTLD